MFLASQFLLKRSQVCKKSSVPSYSIALGLVLYGAIYLYLLFSHQEWVSVFNKFVIYIVGIDLLLSAFFHFNSQQQSVKGLVIEDTGLNNRALRSLLNTEGEMDIDGFVQHHDTEQSDTEQSEHTEQSEIMSRADTEVEDDNEDVSESEMGIIDSEDEHKDCEHKSEMNVEDVENSHQQLPHDVDVVENFNQQLLHDVDSVDNVSEHELTVPKEKKRRGRPPKISVI